MKRACGDHLAIALHAQDSETGGGGGGGKEKQEQC